MPYLGKQAEEGGALIRSHEFLQGTDTGSGTSAFTVASANRDYVKVFLNGVLLQEGASNDYTKTPTAVTITGTAPADGDILKIDVYESITIWDTVPATGGTFSGAVTASAGVVGNLTGNTPGTAATVTGATQSAITTAANLVTVGALDTGSITSGFTSIDVGAGAISTTGAISGGTIDATTDFTVGGTVITNNTITDDGTLTITATTGITLGQDTALSAGKDLETSTTGKIKQKGAFMQHSTNQAWVMGG